MIHRVALRLPECVARLGKYQDGHRIDLEGAGIRAQASIPREKECAALCARLREFLGGDVEMVWDGSGGGQLGRLYVRCDIHEEG